MKCTCIGNYEFNLTTRTQQNNIKRDNKTKFDCTWYNSTVPSSATVSISVYKTYGGKNTREEGNLKAQAKKTLNIL